MARPISPTGRRCTLPRMPSPLPQAPPFTLRARLLSPLADGSTLWLPDGLIEVDAAGRIASVGAAADDPRRAEDPDVIDVRPLIVMPGLVDCHVHLPQIPSAGLGAGLHLLDWLERHVFTLERQFRVEAAERLAPAAYRAMAAAGTTTFAGYGAVWADSTDACFRAAESHGIRAILGAVMMDRVSYDEETPAAKRLERSLRESAELAERWHGAADGRLRYAFTPRFAVSCTDELLRESAALADRFDATWQTHVSEDELEIDPRPGALPGRRRLRRRLRARRRARTTGAPRARHPSVRPRGRAGRGDRHGGGALSGEQHVHRQWRHAARSIPQ